MDFLTQELDVAQRPAQSLLEEFSSRDELIEFLTADRDLTDIDGVGDRTSRKVFSWYQEEYPDKNRQRRRESDSYCTEYTSDVELDDTEKPLWAWICPRCAEKNRMNAYPSECANRPYACVKCRWISLLCREPMEPLIEELG